MARTRLPLEKLGLGRSRPTDAVKSGGTGACDGRGRRRGWPNAACWPFARPSRRPAEDPQTVAAHLRLTIERPEWDAGGGSRLIRREKGWEGLAWRCGPIVDLGLPDACSVQPLLLGRLEIRARRLEMEGLRRVSVATGGDEAERQPEHSAVDVENCFISRMRISNRSL